MNIDSTRKSFAITMKGWYSFMIIFILISSCKKQSRDQLQERPNVLFIICDDLNDFIEGWGGHPQARTPNIAGLAAQGTSFLNAHSNDPVCAPSRASLFTGIYPHNSGLYSFEKWMDNPILVHGRTMMEHFSHNGYQVYGTGKLLHHDDPELYDEFGHPADYGPYAFNGRKESDNYWPGFVAHPSVPEPYRSIGPVDGSFAPLSDVPDVPPGKDHPGYRGWYTINGPFHFLNEQDRDLTPDELNAEWAARKIRELDSINDLRPFFLGVGFIRPHTPLHAPEKYFDLFPLDSILLPEYLEDDLVDCAPGLVTNNGYPKGPRHFSLLAQSYPGREGLTRFVQAYLACIAFVDDQAGKVLDALNNSQFRNNTIVVFTSDHGYHLGEKDQLFKHTLWEQSTRIPYIIKSPGIGKPGNLCNEPVSLIDIYPTLIDLCGLTENTRKNIRGLPLDGQSLKNLIRNPDTGDREGYSVSLTAIISGNVEEGRNIPMNARDQHFSVRSRDWRYSLSAGGGEELYDHRDDPNEWHNLAADRTCSSVLQEHRKMLSKLTGRMDESCRGDAVIIREGFETQMMDEWINLGHSEFCDEPENGDHALIINGGKGGVQRFHDASPGDRFTLRAYMKQNGSPSWSGFGIDFLDGQGETIAEYALQPDITGEYFPFTMTRQAPDSTLMVEIWFYKGGMNGSLYVDEVCLIRNDISK